MNTDGEVSRKGAKGAREGDVRKGSGFGVQEKSLTTKVTKGTKVSSDRGKVEG